MEPNEYWRKFDDPDDAWYILISVFCVFVGTFGVILNVTVIFFILKKKGKKSSEKYFILSLATSDLLKSMLNLPLKLISNINKKWMFGDLGCQIYGFTGGLLGFESITVMALMTVERYLIIRNPLNALRDRNKLISYLAIFSWIYSSMCALSQFFSQNGYVLEGMLTSCTFDYLNRDIKNRSIIFFMSIFGFFIPFMTILVFYVLVVHSLRAKTNFLYFEFKKQEDNSYCSSFKQHHIIYNLDEQGSHSMNIIHEDVYEIDNMRVPMKSSFNATKSRNFLIKREFRVTKMIMICVGAFCVTWFPYVIVVLIAQFGSNIKEYVTPLSASLPALFSKLSVILNPLLYTLTSKKFRLNLLNIISKKC